MRVVNVAVGCPAAFVASDVETDSHEGNCWVGAVMEGVCEDYCKENPAS